jgi:hypothetical protein
MDILFSEESDKKEDTLLGAAIKNAGNIVMGFSK